MPLTFWCPPSFEEQYMSPSSFAIRLFGRFSFLQNDHELDLLQSAKARELFCYLLLNRDQPHSREILASLLWNECTTAQSKKYFRQALWQLQQAFYELSPAETMRPLRVEGEYLQLAPDVDACLDVAVFEKAFASVRGLPGERISGQDALALKNTVSLYRGELLEGWFQDWCIFHRERLQSCYLAMLDKLMAYSEAHHEYESGISFGERLLQKDNARERTYCRLMRLHHLAGDRAGALREFQRCLNALETELGVKPAKRTLELYEQIRTDQVAPPVSPPSAPSAIDPPFAPRLKRLRSLLLKLSHRIERDIQELDQVLSARVTKPRSGRQ
jgi:DNA-binding SARP family transcriptional activator